MKKIIVAIFAGLLLIGANAYANDVVIDSDGNVETGVSSPTSGNLEVTGASAEDAIVGSTSGTGASGVYGINTTFGNYGILGYDNYGVFGYSSGGWAGYFQGKVNVTGTIKSQTLQVTTGAVAGNVLTSDAIGNATWQAAPADGDSDPLNEIQTLKLGDNKLAITGTGGNFVDLSGVGSDTLAGLNCADAEIAKYKVGTGWICYPDGDNLGNHTATSNIILGTKYLSGDGGNEGIVISSAGLVGIGAPAVGAKFQVSNPDMAKAAYFINSNAGNNLPAVYANTVGSGQAIFGLNQGTGRAGHFQIFNPANSASALRAETNGTGYAGEFLGNVNIAGNLTANSLIGKLTATQNITLGANYLSGDGGNEGIMVDAIGRVGVGTATPSARLEVIGLTSDSTSAGLNVLNSSSSSALYVRNDGRVGIGTTWPLAKLSIGGDTFISRKLAIGLGAVSMDADLQVDGQDGVLFTGTYNAGTGTIPQEGVGTRMMWYPEKAAFRAGIVDGNHWNDVYIGDYSVAMGRNTLAIGDGSTAMGSDSTADGYMSISMGTFTMASGAFSTAMGNYTAAIGDYSTSMGSYTNAMGINSTTMGGFTIAESGFETVVGRYDTNYSPSDSSGWSDYDRLFVIGNGSSDSNRSDAMVIRKNGNAEINGFVDINGGLLVLGDYQTPYLGAFFNENINGESIGLIGETRGQSGLQTSDKHYGVKGQATGGLINYGVYGIADDTTNGITNYGIYGYATEYAGYFQGNLAYTGALINASDRRLKENIIPIENALNMVASINGVYYNKIDTPDKTEVGVIAQDVQAVLPETVHVIDPENGYLGVDYPRLVPVLIEAVKELKAENEALTALVCQDHPEAALCQ